MEGNIRTRSSEKTRNATPLEQETDHQSHNISDYRLRHKFKKSEDILLTKLVEEHTIGGKTDWGKIAKSMNNRTPRQCRERYVDYLSDELNKEPFSEIEDESLMEKYNEFGNDWGKICTFFPGRRRKHVKNRIFTLVRRKNKRTEKILKQNPNPIEENHYKQVELEVSTPLIVEQVSNVITKPCMNTMEKYSLQSLLV